MNLFSYRKTFLQKLETNKAFLIRGLKHPVRLLNLLGVRLLAMRFRPMRTPFLPWTLDLEPTVVCNLDCVMCHSKMISGSRTPPHLSFDHAKKIIDDIPTLMRITVQGMGEPLLAPDFFKIVDYAANRKDIAVTTSSNGILITPEVARKIVESGLVRIYISLDGATKGTYEKIRRKGHFEKALTGIRNLLAARKKRGSPSVDIWMVGMQENIHEVPDMVDLAVALGVDSLTVQPDVNFWGKQDFRHRMEKQTLHHNAEMAGRIVEEAQHRARKKGFNFVCHRSIRYSDMKPCLWPWGGGFVATTGDLVPCCVLADPNLLRLGNVLERSFRDVWNGEMMRLLRNSLKQKKLMKPCRDCYES